VASLRVLDDATAAGAARDPEAFRAAPPATQPLDDGWLSLTLTPHAVVRVDVAGATSSATMPGGDD
jgi:hypothetical protein